MIGFLIGLFLQIFGSVTTGSPCRTCETWD
jgi:hypothetical protein